MLNRRELTVEEKIVVIKDNQNGHGEHIMLHTLNYLQNSYTTIIAIPFINIFIVLANYDTVNDDNDTLKIIPYLKQFVDLDKIIQIKFLKMNHISRWVDVQLILQACPKPDGCAYVSSDLRVGHVIVGLNEYSMKDKNTSRMDLLVVEPLIDEQ
ncbi:unnamed protein product [Rotaria sordida]|uniref:Uncharacterized protein n=2 Tax=Rotaria sordida TaxID=392033 RepID=A0A819L2T2_9BILA|nr:unnamed protein product [Rotaria sordida]